MVFKTLNKQDFYYKNFWLGRLIWLCLKGY